jgi:radical SAM protein with 4Fe4S-binding SPASM domain
MAPARECCKLLSMPPVVRRLPLAPHAAPALRDLPLEDNVRPIDKRSRPIYAVWEITLKCDLACGHCGSRAGRARPDELSTEQCFDLIRQMSEMGVKEVTVIGGEAYLREDWTEIIAEIRRLGMDCTMTSGGRAITKERAEAAKKAGLMSVSISLDGLEEAHDQLRGVNGSFKAALASIQNLRAAGIPVSVNTQVNKLTHRNLPELLEVMIANRAHAWQLQLTVPMGRAADDPDIMLQPYDLLEVYPQIAALLPRAKEGGVRVFPGNNLGYFGPYEHLLRAHMPRGHGGSCGAGRGTLGIEADGTIKGCPSLQTEDWAGGNVLQHSLQDIWERSNRLRYMRDRTVKDLWGYCATCYYADECRSGCSWMGHSLFGKPGNNPFCHHRAIEMDKRGVRERVVLKEAAPGLPFDRGLFELIEEPRDTSAAE